MHLAAKREANQAEYHQSGLGGPATTFPIAASDPGKPKVVKRKWHHPDDSPEPPSPHEDDDDAARPANLVSLNTSIGRVPEPNENNDGEMIAY